MKEPSPRRRRTLELQARARRFSVQINANCPHHLPDLPSRTEWEQLVRAADSQSNNLVEADAASSDADFLHKMQVALREAKESKECLLKIREGKLAGHHDLDRLQQEAGELSSIYATIIINMKDRLRRENEKRRR
jgi:four helix bundle protein